MKRARLAEKLNRGSIRYTIFISFTVSALLAIFLTGITFYIRYSRELESAINSENQLLINQTEQTLGSYLRNMIRVSDSICYDIIKNTDLAETSIDGSLNLLYNANSAYIEGMMLFTRSGELLSAAPAAIISENAPITTAQWFTRALTKPENVHFSTPAVRRVAERTDGGYDWVISLSCAVELTREKQASIGVLLIDLKYGGISEAFRNPELAGGGYMYLTDSSGELIFHPKQQLINSGYSGEDSTVCAALKDGAYIHDYNGETRSVIVKTVGYTGWKLVGIVPQQGITFGTVNNIIFLLLVFCSFFLLLMLMNSYISTRLTDPIKRLESSVTELERGAAGADIYLGGSYEIRHLGRAIERMVEQKQRLTEAMMREHEQKQKSELNALQAQINPHFLYNTLDIIVWMIENEKPDDAVRIVSALARFFRISLSKGRDIIPVQDETEHARSYLMIQHMRYKDKFSYTIDITDEAARMSVIKLVLQPIVENAIYHGMDYMDGDGLIAIKGVVEDGLLLLSVSDNGLGMTPEVVRGLLSGDVRAVGSSRGSGIGLKNVHERIKLYFGEQYGVFIESEPDIGTTVTLRLPAVPYEKNNGGMKGGDAL